MSGDQADAVAATFQAKTFYVYELVDPRDNTVFYVGKGKGRRIEAHEAEARRGKQSRKCDRIREILAAGKYVHKRFVSYHDNEDEAYLAEWALIQANENLTNNARYCQSAAKRVRDISDAIWIRATAELANRSKGGFLSVSVMGHEINLRAILERYAGKSAAIIARRGIEWANKIASKYNVRFAYGASL